MNKNYTQRKAQWYIFACTLFAANLTLAANKYTDQTFENMTSVPISVATNETVKSVTGSTFANNNAAYGGIHNFGGTINEISGNTFTNNITSQSGGAIHNSTNSVIGKITNNKFVGHTALNGGAICNIGQINKISGNEFVNNVSSNSGGAVFNEGIIGEISGSSFIGNHAGDRGGAIVNNSEDAVIGILAQASNVELTGNTSNIKVGGEMTDGIHSAGIVNKEGFIHLNAYGDYQIIVNDSIKRSAAKGGGTLVINNGLDGFGNQIKGDDFGVVTFNNLVEKQLEVRVDNGTLKLSKYTNSGSDKTYHGALVADSVATIVASDMVVNSAARLQIAASGVSFTDSDLTVDGRVEFDEGSDLTFDVAKGDVEKISFGASSAVVFGLNSKLVSGGDLTFADGAEMIFDIGDVGEDGDVFEFEFLVDADDLDTILTQISDSKIDVSTIFAGTGLTFAGVGETELENGEFTLVKNGDSLKLTAQIPEPATLGLLGLISGGMLFVRRRFLS